MTCPGESTARPALRGAISETRSTPSPEAREIPRRIRSPAGPSARADSAPRPCLQSGPVPALPSADDVPDRGGAAAAWSAPGVRGARPAAARRARGTEPACWSCAAKRASASRRCWTTCGAARPDVGSPGWPAWSPRWSWPSPACISCARRCSTGWSDCRSLQRDALQAGVRPDRAVTRRIGFSSGWRCSACSPTRPSRAAGLSRGRRAVARPGVRADARVRRAPSAGRAGGARVRGA